ncbi:NUDIX hydrolase [Citricoccus sp. NPDC055426]|uniref:NUDIX hydrolase n=1 Tax=Citricoccus sp. NPDC055426 TaxID=3155536 RepID=UPI003442C366
MSLPVPQAASILLLRPGTASPGQTPATATAAGPTEGAAPEIFTITRSSALVFSAGVSAFPGGRIDPADELAGYLWEGTDLTAWATLLGLDAGAAGMVLAGAVRETFEETGVLLAQHQDGTPVRPEALAGLPAEARIQVEHHGLDFGTLLSDHGLRPDVSGMRPLSRWITPEGPPRRYDTYFFAAALPAGQAPGVLSFEGVDSRWTTAADALADFRAGIHQLMAPTWSQFRTLLPAETLAQALTPTGPIQPVIPVVTSGDPHTATGFAEAEAFERDVAAGWTEARTE